MAQSDIQNSMDKELERRERDEEKKPKKDSGGGDGNPNAWMITFSDLVNLMITFFVLLLSMSSLDAKKVKQTFEAFSEVAYVLQGSEYREVRPEIIQTVDPFIFSTVAEGLVKYLKESDEKVRRSIMQKLAKTFAQKVFRKFIKIEVEKEHPEVYLANNLLFVDGSAELSEEAKKFLREFSEILKIDKFKLRVEAHTNLEPKDKKRYPTSWDLALNRSVNVVSFLTEKVGVSPRDLSASAYGAPYNIPARHISTDFAEKRQVKLILLKK